MIYLIDSVIIITIRSKFFEANLKNVSLKMSLNSGDVPSFVKFVCAATAGMSSALICYPLDVVRLRMQLVGEGKSNVHRDTTYRFMKNLLRNEGIGTFYNGISASLLRQCLYTGGRLGAFQTIVDYITKDGSEINFSKKMMVGTISGCFGAIIGLPPDVVLTRMAVDNSSPEAERRKYKHVFDAFRRIVKEEGAATLATGLKVTVLRAVIVNCSQLVTYTETKKLFITHKLMKDMFPLHIVSSIVATLILTICVLPPDIAKTRLQKMRTRNNIPEYNGFLDVWIKIIRSESVFSLWKGFTPLFIKAIPYNLTLLIVYEDVLLANYKRIVMHKKE